MKKTKSVVCAACIAAALTGSQPFVSPAIVQAAENLTPNMSSMAYNGGNIFTQCGYKGECTWFTFGRTYEKLGIKLPTEFYGNAIDWWHANAKDKVFNYGTEPKANSIIVWYGGPKGHGHVGFVEKVVGDTVYFNEGNFSIRGHYDGHLKSMSKEEIKNRGNIFLKGYIYVGEKATSISNEKPSSNTGHVKLSNPDSNLNVRISNNLSSCIIGVLSNNSKVSIIGKYGDWYKIYHGSSYGYVNAKYISLDAGTPSGTGVRTVTLHGSSNTINMRVSPWYGKVIASLESGTQVEVLSTEGRWLKVKAGKQTGYIHSDYVK